MQAVLRRSLRAASQSERQLALRQKATQKIEWDDSSESRKEYKRPIRRSNRRNYRRTIEDWKLGPLAPKRNYGYREENYGALSRRSITMPDVPGNTSIEDSLSYDEYIQRPFYRPEDRVVLIKGTERGMIGVVNAVDESKKQLKLKDLNKIYAYFSGPDAQWINNVDATNKAGALTPAPLSFSDVRLVTKLPDGQEVIVDKMLCIKQRHKSGTDVIRRYIPGTMHDIDIDCDIEPKDVDESAGNIDYGYANTFQYTLLQESWAPTITLDQPFPGSIIDELRDKYSKHRTRHTDEFVERMLAIDEKKELKIKAGKMMLRTPEKEYGRQQRIAARKLASRKRLSRKSSSLLRQHMAKNRSLSE